MLTQRDKDEANSPNTPFFAQIWQMIRNDEIAIDFEVYYIESRRIVPPPSTDFRFQISILVSSNATASDQQIENEYLFSKMYIVIVLNTD